MKTLTFNKRARFDYDILETLEAGIELLGFEVKSVRKGQVSLKGSYVVIQSTGIGGKPEAWLINAHISLYKPAGEIKFNPTRSRKLLLHHKEIDYLLGKQKEKGLTLVPISLYTAKKRIKLEFGVGRGKKKFEKRETIKKREAKRKIERVMKGKI
jgi:SsrA-binding protein